MEKAGGTRYYQGMYDDQDAVLSLEQAVTELRRQDSAAAALQRAYEILGNRYRGQRWATLTRFPELFVTSETRLWPATGFMHCTNINRLLRSLLLASGYFQEDDIRSRWTLIWFFSPHQYLCVRAEGRWIDVDVWARIFGIRFGDHAWGFHKTKSRG